MAQERDAVAVRPPAPLEAHFPSTQGAPTRRVGALADTMVDASVYVLLVATPLAFGTVEPWSIALAELVIFASAFMWGLGMVARRELRIEPTALNLGWLLVLGWGALQLLPLPLPVLRRLSPQAASLYEAMAFEPGRPAPWRPISLAPYATKQELLRLLALALLFWVVANGLRTRAQVDRVFRLILAMGFLLALVGLVQHFAGNGKLYGIRALAHGGNPFGPYVNRNHFAGYLEMVIPLTLGWLVATRRPRVSGVPGWRTRLLRWGTPEASGALLTFFSGLLMVAALLLTGSRGGLLSFLGSMLLMAALLAVREAPRLRWWGLLALFVTLGVAGALWINPAQILQSVASLGSGTADSSARARLLIWEDTLRLGRAYRWSGTGLNTFAWAFPLYKRPIVGQGLYDYTHNDYIQAFAEGGLPFVALLTLALLCGGAQLLKGWVASQRPYERGIGLGLLGGLGAMLLHSASDFNLHIMANAILFVVLLALACRVLLFRCLPVAAPSRDGSSYPS